MSIKLTNIISNQVVLLGNIDNTVKLTNKMEADVVLYTANTASQWYLKTGFFNDAGRHEDNANWID